jgi:P27 family predicted phage terminase small subunit
MPGPRRHTLAEAKLGGPKAASDHRRNHGTSPSAADRTAGDLGKPPAWLDADSKAQWRRIIDAAPAGLLHTIDAATVEALAGAMSRYRRWMSLLQSSWKTADIENLARIDRQAHRAAAQVAMLGTTLGLTPVARSRLQVPEMWHEDDGELAELGLRSLVVHEPDGRRWVRPLPSARRRSQSL